MSGLKRRVQNYLGVEESSPQSVHAMDWFKSHKGDLRTDVSFILSPLVVVGPRQSNMTDAFLGNCLRQESLPLPLMGTTV